MKIKTSITISEDLLKTIDEFAGESRNRSQFLEVAAREYIAKVRRAQQNQRDLAMINQRADALNEATSDALEYQIAL